MNDKKELVDALDEGVKLMTQALTGGEVKAHDAGKWLGKASKLVEDNK